MVTINFDTDANGNALNSPPIFQDTTALTNLYSSLGINFSGSGSIINGGAILDEDGNFGVPALSGSGFLAFNRDAILSDGGIPTDPEIITFNTPISNFSIFASGGENATTFQLQAFDSRGILIGSTEINTGIRAYEELAFSSELNNISQITLTEIGGDDTFVFDNLSFSSVSTITGTNGADNLNGTNNSDRIEGLGGSDRLFGLAGNDTIIGGNGNDSLVGAAGNDSLIGGNGSDSLFGGDGNDTLDGGIGFDVLTSGAGSDLFVLKNGNGSDSITDFRLGSDQLGLAGDLEFEDLTLFGNTIKSGNELLATLIGVNTGNLTEANFTTL
jgi:Ca2+-binding RTX toxin-like protein